MYIPKMIQESEFQHSRRPKFEEARPTSKQRLCKHRCDTDGFKVRDVGAAENRFLNHFCYKFLFTMICCAFSISCQATWTATHPRPISIPYTYTYAGVFCSCDPTTGVFLATWADASNNQYPTYSFYTPATGWSLLDTITTPSGAVVTTNVITSCDPISGKFFASWTDLNTRHPTSSVYSPGFGWSLVDPLTTTTATVNSANSFDPMTGQFLVTWADMDHDSNPSYAFYAPGIGWGPTATISMASRAGSVYTSFDATNNQFLAVWADTGTGLPMHSFYTSGAWTTATPIALASVNNDVLCSFNPNTGQFIATWSDVNQNLYPFYSIYTPGHGWSPAATITTTSSVIDNVAISCDLTTGQFLASWSNLLNGMPTYTFYSPSGGWGLPVVLSPSSVSSGDIITVFNAETQQFLATWSDRSDPDRVFNPTYSFLTQVKGAGASSIETASGNGAITIHAGGSFRMHTGAFSNASAVINAAGDAVTIVADGVFDLDAATSISASNANVLINSGGNISLQGSEISLQAGSAINASVGITTTNGGLIDLTSAGPISIHGGIASSQNAEVSLQALKGGDINISGDAITLNAGSGVNAPVQIMTGFAQGSGAITLTGSSIHITGDPDSKNKVLISAGWVNTGTISLESTGAIALDTTTIGTNSFVGANPITLTASETIALSNSSVKTNLGDISFFAEGSISLDSTSQVNAGGNDALALFVIDSENTMPSSSFTYPTGAQIIANKSNVGRGAVRIYTVTHSQNSIDSGSNINGLTYIPETEFLNTNQEYWDTTYPTVPAPSMATPQPDGTDHFTIYYQAAP